MAAAANFPLFFPADATRAFGSAETVHRLARVAGWSGGSKLLELGCGGTAAALALVKELGCSLTLADDDQTALEKARDRAKTMGIQDRITTQVVDFKELTLGDVQYDGILALCRALLPLEQAVELFRKHLAVKGRLCLAYPVRVGRYPASVVTEHFEKRLGQPLLLPRECLQTLERNGFDPESVETLSNTELDDFYQLLEPHIAIDEPAAGLREEMSLHKTAGGRGSFSYGLVIGRRKEPGEKPPVSRNE